jgi:hypothetical protein
MVGASVPGSVGECAGCRVDLGFRRPLAGRGFIDELNAQVIFFSDDLNCQVIG